MFNNGRISLRRYVAALSLAFMPLLSVAQQLASSPDSTLVSELSTIPAPTLGAKAWLSLDVNSDQIIAAHNIDERIEPASLTKLMTAYLVFDAIEDGRLSLDQEVTVSENAWRTEGSRMFLNPNSQVTVNELLQGMIVQSGNDATVVLAETISGSEEAFAALMNEEAKRQGLSNTHFENGSGLPHPDHLTSVRDLGILAKNLVTRFPQHVHYYSQKEYLYNKINQPNRNRLLWLDTTVDGLKTGHTKSAGYGLVTTALRDGRRIITVVTGTANDAARTEDSLKLLNWSYQNFDTVELYKPNEPIVNARIWEGESENVGLGLKRSVWVTVPRGRANDIKPTAHYTQPLMAPVAQEQQVGNVTFSLEDHTLANVPLLALENVPQAGFVGRMIDKVRMWFN
ncbi:D-alanyl-D-alanine carboxypeptidase family protein [Paenalcaligenes hominis]|uniref:D-alanyl-D-alanine carboxypeptidase family protein n=1 Tax=Paenalcaligenes hominis TaxID=643674 RepID=UPI003526C0FF